MANFRIDTLVLELQGDGTYTLSGECNSDAGNPPTVVNGIYDDTNKEILFDTAAGSPNEKYSFNCLGITFNGYGPADMAKVFFGNVSDPLAKRKKTAAGIKDTVFPPPDRSASLVLPPTNTGHESFSALFKFTKLSTVRNLASNTSNVSIDLFCPAGTKTYTLVSAELMVDPVYAPTEIICIDLHETNVSSPATTLNVSVNAPGGIPMAGFDPFGLPIIVKQDSMSFSEVNTKKGLFYIN